jgi:hypothetical protein
MRLLCALLLVATSTGCEKEEEPAAAGATTKTESKPPASAAKTEPPPSPLDLTGVTIYEGPLDHDRLVAANNASARPKDGSAEWNKWDVGYRILLEQVGKETRVEGNKYLWAVLDGDTCIQLAVENEAGQIKNGVVMKIGQEMSTMFEKCSAHARK